MLVYKLNLGNILINVASKSYGLNDYQLMGFIVWEVAVFLSVIIICLILLKKDLI